MRPTIPSRAAALTSCLLLVALVVLGGCDSGPGESIYDPDASGAPDPVVTSVTPAPGELVLAGIDVLTITGENFSPELSKNIVFFDEVQGEVLEASPSTLVVRTPNTPKPELDLRVTVIGAENFSNTISYRLVAAAERIAELSTGELPTAVAVDDEGNVFFHILGTNVEEVDTGVQRITPDGERSQYAPPAFVTWQDLAFGPDGELYGVFGLGALGRVVEGGAPAFDVVLSDAEEPLTALAFDEQGGVWLGSTRGNLFHIDLTTDDVTEYVVDADIDNTQVRDLAVNGGFLYAAIIQQAEGSPQVGKIVRFPIDGASLGGREDYADISAQFAVNPRAIAFAADGDMLVGTSLNEQNDVALLLVSPSGAIEQFYPGIILSPVTKLAWGPDTGVYALGFVAELDATRSRRDIPLAGNADPRADLIRIESRREGA